MKGYVTRRSAKASYYCPTDSADKDKNGVIIMNGIKMLNDSELEQAAIAFDKIHC